MDLDPRIGSASCLHSRTLLVFAEVGVPHACGVETLIEGYTCARILSGLVGCLGTAHFSQDGHPFGTQLTREAWVPLLGYTYCPHFCHGSMIRANASFLRQAYIAPEK